MAVDGAKGREGEVREKVKVKMEDGRWKVEGGIG